MVESGSTTATLLGVVAGLLLCGLVCIVCRIWKRNRYYKKVQHSLDEEERAFQEYAPPQHARCHPPNVARAPHAHGRRVRLGRRTLARSYNDEQHLDGGDHEKLQMLETYLQMQAQGERADFEFGMLRNAFGKVRNHFGGASLII